VFRAIDKWLPGYLRSVCRRPAKTAGTRHLIFCLSDHFEPHGNASSCGDAVRLVREWVEEYPQATDAFTDSDGRFPQHTFFYPAEAYSAECLDNLALLCKQGHGEVEVHLHHRNDTADNLRATLCDFCDKLHGNHGLLGRDEGGRVRYGFIHGNWALCNSRPDGDWCGVNEELAVLKQTGCYADFTFPSAPSPTQPRMVNAIYRAEDRPGRPRGADRGKLVQASGQTPVPPHPALSRRSPEGRRRNTPLLLIQGPLAPDWGRRKWRILPRLENGDITNVNPPLPRRIDLWVRQGIHVMGRPEWVFVKVFSHGCVAGNREALLGERMRRCHEYLAEAYDDGKRWRLHYVTAREMYNIVRAAEDGKAGNPGEYRDYEVARPECFHV